MHLNPHPGSSRFLVQILPSFLSNGLRSETCQIPKQLQICSPRRLPNPILQFSVKRRHPKLYPKFVRLQFHVSDFHLANSKHRLKLYRGQEGHQCRAFEPYQPVVRLNNFPLLSPVIEMSLAPRLGVFRPESEDTGMVDAVFMCTREDVHRSTPHIRSTCANENTLIQLIKIYVSFPRALR